MSIESENAGPVNPRKFSTRKNWFLNVSLRNTWISFCSQKEYHVTLCLWLNWIEYQTTDLRVESSNLSKHKKKFFFSSVAIQKFVKFLRRMDACLAQLVEHRFCKPTVIGSSPIVGWLFLKK